MKTEQIYTLVNSVSAQAMGKSAINVVDTSTLVSLGNAVLSSSQNSEEFLNVLAQRIGRTIISYRKYTNKLADMVLNDFEYGAILQKIKVRMPSAEADQTVGLTNGASVDHYKVSKPDVSQKLFVKRTPYQFKITIQRKWLKEAFLSEVAMGSFIAQIFGEVQNAIELALENLGRATICNFIAESTHEVKLVTEYKTISGDSTITADTCMFNEQFLRFAIKRIKDVSKGMTDMSMEYNDGTETRHTPLEDQRIIVLSEFENALETNVQYAAFNEKFVSLKGFSEVNFWQAVEDKYNVHVTRASDSAEKTIDNVVSIIYDRDALGIYKQEEEVLTTPVNAAGSYYNTYWHESQLWFNDLSENFVVFTLN